MAFKFPSSKQSSMKPFKASGKSSGQGTLLAYMLSQKKRDSVPQDIDKIGQQVGGYKPGAKLSITDRGAEIQQPLNADFTLDESRAIGQSDAFSAHVKYFENAMNEMPREVFISKFKKATTHWPGADRGQVMGFPTTFGDKQAQLLKFALQDMSDRILRLRSGAQINPQEADRLMSLLPTWEDVSDPSDIDFEVIRTKLNQFKNDVENIKNVLKQGGNYNSSLWEGQGGNGLQHPAYSGYLKQNKPTQNPNVDIESERQLAIEAIQSGKEEAVIAKLFKRRTGEDL